MIVVHDALGRIFIGVLLLFFSCGRPTPCHAESDFALTAKRVLFLGDSITHAGDYITLLETQLRLRGHSPTLINLGLPSETCSGLSEPDHPFPRPNVHSRIDNALEKVKPDLVVICYGMNDGIYHPFSHDRFRAFQNGIGLIIEKVRSAKAKLVLMTPPAFDPLPMRKQGKLLALGEKKYSWKAIYENYDQVMASYSRWVCEQNHQVDMVIDLHSIFSDYLASKRRSQPAYVLSGDGVHINREGHNVIAKAILRAWGCGDPVDTDASLVTLVERRQKMMHAAWLSEVGHERPGMQTGLPIAEAEKLATEMEKQITARVLRQLDSDKPEYGDVHRCHFPASQVPGELALFVDFDLWIPPAVEQVRGIILHQHGCGPGASNAGLTAVCDLHWRELAKRWDCALLSVSYEGKAGSECRMWCDPRRGSGKRFLEAIDIFADQTGHAELRQAPWCIWGHSGGGFWASLMQTIYPERIVAIWLQSGTAFGYWNQSEIPKPELESAVFQVPVMGCPGAKEQHHERFSRAWDGLHAMWKAYRLKDAPFGIAPDPGTGHEVGDSRYLAIPFFDSCLRIRLPADNMSPVVLRSVDMSRGWIGTASGEVFPAEEYSGDEKDVSWLPDEKFAKCWAEFLRHGTVRDSTAPTAPHVLTARSVDGATRLSWQADADFESGLGGFRIERDGVTIARIPPRPSSRFGKPIFQVMNYSGTPSQPLAKMEFTDVEKKVGKNCEYRIYSINTVGLESEPAILKWTPQDAG